MALVVPPIRFVIVAVPALEELLKIVQPPVPPLTGLPLLVKVPLPAVEVLKNCVEPPSAPLTVLPLLVKVPLPALETALNFVKPPFAPLTKPPLLVKAPLPALELLKKKVVPPKPPLTCAPLLVKAVMLPAVALLLKRMEARFPAPLVGFTKLWINPELLVMPVPLMVNLMLAASGVMV